MLIILRYSEVLHVHFQLLFSSFHLLLFFFEVVGVTAGIEMGIISDDCFRIVQFHIPMCSSFEEKLILLWLSRKAQ